MKRDGKMDGYVIKQEYHNVNGKLQVVGMLCSLQNTSNFAV